MILGRIKKKLDDAKGMWAEKIHEVLLSYHTIPHSTTKETPFTLVYSTDDMFSVKFGMLRWMCAQFNKEESEAWLRCASDLIDETRDIAHIIELIDKKWAFKSYNSKVVPIEM